MQPSVLMRRIKIIISKYVHSTIWITYVFHNVMFLSVNCKNRRAFISYQRAMDSSDMKIIIQWNEWWIELRQFVVISPTALNWTFTPMTVCSSIDVTYSQQFSSFEWTIWKQFYCQRKWPMPIFWMFRNTKIYISYQRLGQHSIHDAIQW